MLSTSLVRPPRSSARRSPAATPAARRGGALAASSPTQPTPGTPAEQRLLQCAVAILLVHPEAKGIARGLIFGGCSTARAEVERLVAVLHIPFDSHTRELAWLHDLLDHHGTALASGEVQDEALRVLTARGLRLFAPGSLPTDEAPEGHWSASWQIDEVPAGTLHSLVCPRLTGRTLLGLVHTLRAEVLRCWAIEAQRREAARQLSSLLAAFGRGEV